MLSTLFKLSGCIALFFFCLAINGQEQATNMSPDYQKWLKERFQNQHEKLIPIVAVADMYFACHRSRENNSKNYQVKELVTKMSREQLALKLETCLRGELPNSDTALNFGLQGCFYEQIKALPEAERKVKQKLVTQAIASLSHDERKKSFTQCVVDQAIGYLK